MVTDTIKTLKNTLGEAITLVAVSKTKPVEMILEAYHTGHRIFGENKVQEMVEKHDELPKDIEWHLIGHLQRNKVKYIAPFVSLIHAVDSQRLLKEINKQAGKHERTLDCLIQIKIAEETSKFGLDRDQLNDVLVYAQTLENVNITGLMGMATFTDDQDQIHREFAGLKQLYDEYAATYSFKFLSMGMTDDYKIALEEGSNMVRIGSAIFGERN